MFVYRPENYQVVGCCGQIMRELCTWVQKKRFLSTNDTSKLILIITKWKSIPRSVLSDMDQVCDPLVACGATFSSNSTLQGKLVYREV